MTCLCILITCICTNSYAESVKPIALPDEVVLPREMQEQQDRLKRYSSVKDGLVIFDVDAAIAAGEDREIMEIGRRLNEYGRFFSIFSYSRAYPEKPVALPKEMQEQQNRLERYVAVSKEGHVTFDVDAAIAAGEDKEIMEIGRRLNEFSRAMNNPTRSGIPVYGNWCGPWYGDGEPIDALDAICRAHDQCYDFAGWLDCGCDATLRQQIMNYLGFSGFYGITEEQKFWAQAILAWFSISPCL